MVVKEVAAVLYFINTNTIFADKQWVKLRTQINNLHQATAVVEPP